MISTMFFIDTFPCKFLLGIVESPSRNTQKQYSVPQDTTFIFLRFMDILNTNIVRLRSALYGYNPASHGDPLRCSEWLVVSQYQSSRSRSSVLRRALVLVEGRHRKLSGCSHIGSTA